MAEPAKDHFTEYLTEKIWEMIPAFYREEDGIAKNPGVLRALVAILAEQAANLRRSNDRLWDDQFIDLCDSWAVPYIADLLGTRLVSNLDLRARRIDVAKTIYYRRRKGTLRVLEELISDIAQWDGVVVEEFRRLARCWHGLEPNANQLRGRFTSTAQGGYADIRRPRGAELTGGPFDEYFHTADVRMQHGTDGVFNIPKLGFHLYRLSAYSVRGVTPARGSVDPEFLFDPSGRDLPLFSRRHRDDSFDWDQWRSAREWELPAPIRCRELGHAEYEITESAILELSQGGLSAPAAADLRKLRGRLFRSETELQGALGPLSNGLELLNDPVYPSILRLAIKSDCARAALLPASVSIESPPGTVVPSELIGSGNLSQWTAGATGKVWIIDPERGRFLFVGTTAPPPLPQVNYHYGFSAPIGAGSYDRSNSLLPATLPVVAANAAITAADIDAGTQDTIGVTELAGSSTFGPVEDKVGIQNAHIQAQNLQRPYLRLDANWILDSTPKSQAILTIEGLWIGASSEYSIILKGNFESVTIRHSTLDPGGVNWKSDEIPAVALTIAGQVENLIVDHSILASIGLDGDGFVGLLTVSDSIIQSSAASIELPKSRLDIRRTTVFGDVIGEVLYASEAIFTGGVKVMDTQAGCFRFGAARNGSRIPHPYQSYAIDDISHYFTSRRFGHPGYAQLSQSAPQGLLTGAENGSEIGAFSSLLNPIRLDGLRAKIDEYMPFGLIPVFRFET